MEYRKRNKKKRKRLLFLAELFILVAAGALLFVFGANGEKRAKRQKNESVDVMAKGELCLTDGLPEPTEEPDTNGQALDVGLQKQPETEAFLSAEAVLEQDYARIINLPAGALAAQGMVKDVLTDRLFYAAKIDEALLDRISGKSYTPNETVAVSDLSYLRMLCFGPDGNTYVGEMIVNRAIETDILNIFRELYENRYPIERMTLIDDYGADDEASMQANNTSAFNYRTIAGSSRLSNHSYGLAVDLNPKYNPYVKTASDGSLICQPPGSEAYADRSGDFAYKIDENDLAYHLFTQAGFTWGGGWSSVKDYQHFEKER